jgi:hypothetical protein
MSTKQYFGCINDAIPTIYVKGGAETDVFIVTRKWKGNE